MISKIITPKEYDFVLNLDQKLYPISTPVTKEIIKSWYIKNPEFAVIFEESNEILGLLVAIPLNSQGWKKLIEGKIKESELTENTLFDNSRDEDIGIHIYHIEKLNSKTKEFHKTTLEYLASVLKKLKSKNDNLQVMGFSGLCVTNEGVNLFEKKLNCKERDFILDEHIFEKENARYVVETKSRKVIDNKFKEGYQYITKCKMLVLYPKEKSIIWDYLNQ